METLLKRKGLWHFMKTSIVDLMDVDAKFSIDVKKDEVVGVIMTYISREIHFHTSVINYPHAVWTKLNTFFNKINDREVMHTEKYFISLELLSFDRIEDYLAHIK